MIRRALRDFLRQMTVVFRWLRFPLAGLAAIVAVWYFGPAELRNLTLVLLGPFVVVLGVAVVAILLVVGLPKAAPAPRQRLRPWYEREAIRARAEVVQGEVVCGPLRELESGDVR